MQRKIMALAVSALTLAGCVNTSSPEFIKKTAARCAAYGYKQGTNESANCQMTITMAQEQENARKRQALSEGIDKMNADMQRERDRQALIQSAQIMSRPVYNTMPVYQPQRTINCVSRPGYGYMRTTCN